MSNCPERARRLLQQVLEVEIAEHLDRYAGLLTHEQHRAVVRNDYAPERRILTGIGPVAVPRILGNNTSAQDRLKINAGGYPNQDSQSISKVYGQQKSRAFLHN